MKLRVVFLCILFLVGLSMVQYSYSAPVLKKQTVNTIQQNVYVLVYNPVFQDGKKLTEYFNWADPAKMVTDNVNFFKEASNTIVSYNVVEVKEVNGFIKKTDGFLYTEETYKACVESGGSNCHSPDEADYNAILNNTEYDICGKLNRGEIQELWIIHGPWFGFWESALAGPRGIPYNGATYSNNACSKLLPIIGNSYERADEFPHNNGHRTEATMEFVYGGWEENRMQHNWDKFGLVAEQSPQFGFSGCGSMHYPPNAKGGYDYGNKDVVNTFCDVFIDYPNLPEDVSKSLKPISCDAWGCTASGYYKWWFQRIPHAEGTGLDGILNNWWVYILDPNAAANARKVSPTPIQKTTAQFTFLLSGIGDAGDTVNPRSGGNTSPQHMQRDMKVSLVHPAGTTTKDIKIQYDTVKKTFSGSTDLEILQDESTVSFRFKSPNYLEKMLDGVIVRRNQTNQIVSVRMVPGDMNEDNKLDLLDYNQIRECYSGFWDAKNCSDLAKKQRTDLNDDGTVNQYDYNLFLRELSKQTAKL